MSGASLLEQVFAAAAAAGQRPPLTDNVDPERFPSGMEAVTPARSQQRMDHLNAHAARWEWLAASLGDTSRALLTALLTFHLLGHRRARVGPSSVELRALLNQAYERLVIERDVTPIAYAGSAATHRFDLAPIGYDITLESYMLGVQGTFQLQQYRSRTHPEARARTGDVAIDAGACFGETALWLADTVGPTGRVHTLEFAPANLTILKANLERNPRLADRIVLTEAALWETRRAALTMDRGGPASMVTGAPAGLPAAAPVTSGGSSVPAIGLDELVTDAGLDRVDFVKMDIEGAEPAALRGAGDTLERWRPKVALAAYHDIDHLWQLPLALSELACGYRFALGHFTMHAEETVLYGWVT